MYIWPIETIPQKRDLNCNLDFSTPHLRKRVNFCTYANQYLHIYKIHNYIIKCIYDIHNLKSQSKKPSHVNHTYIHITHYTKQKET